MLKVTRRINQFTGYNRTIAICQMDNWGFIILDDYGDPLEVEDVSQTLLEELEGHEASNIDYLDGYDEETQTGDTTETHDIEVNCDGDIRHIRVLLNVHWDDGAALVGQEDMDIVGLV